MTLDVTHNLIMITSMSTDSDLSIRYSTITEQTRRLIGRTQIVPVVGQETVYYLLKVIPQTLTTSMDY